MPPEKDFCTFEYLGNIGTVSLPITAAIAIASQTASISFQALIQVRNKFVSAYQDIMNMPV